MIPLQQQRFEVLLGLVLHQQKQKQQGLTKLVQQKFSYFLLK